MSEPVEKAATYEDLLRVPPNRVAEIVNGRLHTHPRPGPKHARASASLGGELFQPFDKGSGGPGGWWILDGPEIRVLEAYRNQDAHWVQLAVFENDDPVSVAPFDAIEFALDSLWVG